jgi:hypothetical protein
VNEPAPLVYSVSRQLALLAPARLVLGLAGLGASLAVADRGGPVGGAFTLGAFAAAFLLATDRRFVRRRLEEPARLPPTAVLVPPVNAAVYGLFPSTVGVSVLAAISLAFEPVLAGLLAGVLGGMGIVSGAALVSILATERRSGRRLFAARGSGRLYSAA